MSLPALDLVRPSPGSDGESKPDSRQEPHPVEPSIDVGLQALTLVAARLRVAADPQQIAHDLALGHRNATPEDLVRAAQNLGLRARILKRVSPKRLANLPLPAIVHLKNGGYGILGARLANGGFRLVSLPSLTASECPLDEISQVASGTVILVTRRPSKSDAEPAKFGFSWFIPSIWRYRRPLVHVFVASLFLQCFALITPLFFQVVIDKVLLHKGFSTLVAIAAGLAIAGLFEVILQYLRTYALSHTTSRIDVELGARLFDHLLRLPLSYFETRPTGQTVARVREIEKIRDFLTGHGLSSVLDLLFTLIFIAVLFMYSVELTVVVLISIPCYLAIALIIRPILRERIKQRFESGAASQQFLVESIFGIQTLKASAVEPMLRTQWEERLASYVSTSFNAVMLGTLGQNAIQYVDKITTVLVLFLGAQAVIRGDLSVGGLIAFNMIMHEVTSPVLRLSQLWQDFQQVQISIERMGDILDAPTESRRLANANLPPAKGDIQIKGVTFRYEAGGREILNGIDISIPAGQVVGIVGASGSGKSTLTKLIQQLYRPEKGQVLVDGIDIAQVDTAWLRQQIGVVLQENTLFDRSIHENIALSNPAMARAQVMTAARLAGADEFISRLPLGYDTHIVERGANLSGGQRQRIAIARALVTRPRILILDEATSALDYESERIIQTNMKSIVRGRTVIIIAHRLAAVRNCNRIIAMQEGRVIEDGPHKDLLAKPNGIYSKLWRMQSENSEE
jgi:ATP-binding cassette, subfamily B, bacterial HlyB/CyaB